MKALKALLRPLRAKIFAEGLLKYLLYSLAAGGVICGIIKLLGRFIYSVGIWANNACIAVVIVSVVCGVLVTFRRRPGDIEIARRGDALGYKERLVTALEILSQNEAPKGSEKLVVEDALKTVNGGELRRSYKITPPKRALICAFCAAVFFVGSGFIPVPEKLVQQFAQRQELEEKIAEEIEKLDEAVEESLENMPDQQRSEVEQRLDELREELKQAESENEAVDALQKAQEDIQRIENETVEDLQAVGEALAQNQAAGLGDALANGDIAAVSEALQNATAVEQAAAADALNQAAEGLAGDSELGQALQEAADALQSGDSDTIADSLDNLQDTYNNATKGSAGTNGVNNAISDAEKNIKGTQQGNASGTQSGSDSQSGSSGTQNGSGSQSGSSGSQNGSDSQSGSSGTQNGSGSQSGSSGTQNGSGSQSGSSGTQNDIGSQGGSSGTQSGSDLQDGSGAGGAQGGSTQGGSGTGAGSGHIPDEQIYSRGAEDMAGYGAQLEGYEGEAGEYVTEERQAIGTGGEVPYSEVYNEYKDAALESLNDSSVPSGLQDIVREYFSTLE